MNKNTRVLIVGGDWNNNISKLCSKPSAVIRKLSEYFSDYKLNLLNSGNIYDLPYHLFDDLIIWMPNISNENVKQYPGKRTGSVLICSKVMREGYTKIDALSRVYSMQGNAVIAIYKEQPLMRFELIDALGNVWYTGNSLESLSKAIIELYDFLKEAIRYSSIRSTLGYNKELTLDDKDEKNIQVFPKSPHIMKVYTFEYTGVYCFYIITPVKMMSRSYTTKRSRSIAIKSLLAFMNIKLYEIIEEKIKK